MKIKIVSDGQRTQVLDEQDQPIPGVQLVSFCSAVDGAPEAFLHVQGVQCEIVVDAQAGLLPATNPYRVQDLQVVPQDLKEFFGHDDSTD